MKTVKMSGQPHRYLVSGSAMRDVNMIRWYVQKIIIVSFTSSILLDSADTKGMK